MKLTKDILSKWRHYYDATMVLGHQMKQHYQAHFLLTKSEDKDNLTSEQTAQLCQFILSPEELNTVNNLIDSLKKECMEYLDNHDIKPKAPLWKFDSENETTWISSDKFAYGHLVTNR